MLLMALLVSLLAACGGGDDDDEPTAAPTQQAPATEAEPAVTPTIVAPSATPANPGLATPAVPGTPVASPVASPVIGGTPVMVASPVASPAAAASPGAGSANVPVVAANETGAGETQVIAGTVSLPGTANQQFVIADDGCVGLGKYAGVQAGQQVVIEDEAGAIIGVAELAATGSAVVCAWTFEAEVPVSAYYTISLPMIAEHVYTGDEVAGRNGQIELTLP